MNSKEELLSQVASLVSKTAAAVEGKPKPVVEEKSKPVVEEEVKEEPTKTAASAALWKYTDKDGKDFYLAEKQVGVLRSPFTGKSFTTKPVRYSLGEVGKEIKEDAKKVKKAGDQGNLKLAAALIQEGESHPAIKVIKAKYDSILEGINKAAGQEIEMDLHIMQEVQPKIVELGKVALRVAEQLKERLSQGS